MQRSQSEACRPFLVRLPQIRIAQAFKGSFCHGSGTVGRGGEHDQHPPDTAPESGSRDAVILHPGEGTPLSMGGSSFHFITGQENISGKLTSMLYHSGPDVQGPPPHYHKETAEAVFLLTSSLTFNIDGKTLKGETGSFVYIPPGLIHTWTNDLNKSCSFLGFGLPAGLEGYFSSAKSLMEKFPTWPPEDMSEIAALGRKYDQFMVGKPD